MKTTQGRTQESLLGTHAFLVRNADRVPRTTGTGAFTRLEQNIAMISGHASNQAGNAMTSESATQSIRALRLALLRDHMRPVAFIAKSALEQTPEIEPLRLPAGRPTPPRLAAAARGMARAAEPFADVFVAFGLPVDFMEQMDGAADALLAAVNARRQCRADGVAATEGLKLTLTAGRKLVHVLNAYVQGELKDDAELLAGWNAVKRVQVIGRRKADLAGRIAERAPAPEDPGPMAAGGASLAPGLRHGRLRILDFARLRREG